MATKQQLANMPLKFLENYSKIHNSKNYSFENYKQIIEAQKTRNHIKMNNLQNLSAELYSLIIYLKSHNLIANINYEYIFF